jgi:hypothetical protein
MRASSTSASSTIREFCRGCRKGVPVMRQRQRLGPAVRSDGAGQGRNEERATPSASSSAGEVWQGGLNMAPDDVRP